MRNPMKRWSAVVSPSHPLTGTLLAVLMAGSAVAQDLQLPKPMSTTVFSNRRIETTWAEIDPTVGRRAEIDTLRNWDPDSSSTPTISGNYVGDCDFRLRFEKVAQSGDSFGRNIQMVAKLYDRPQAVGSPLALDTLAVLEGNTPFPLDPAVAPNISLSFTPNAVQPSATLGSIPVIVGGLNTSQSKVTTYQVSALSSIANFPSPADTLRVRVTGPITRNGNSVPVGDRLSRDYALTSTTEVIAVMNGMTLRFGSGAATAGDVVDWTAHYLMPPIGIIDVDLESFEGYHIWRSDLPDLNSLTLIGEIRACLSKSDLAVLNEEEIDEANVDLTYDPTARRFTFVDRDVHNDFPYRYAISTFDTGYFGNVFGTFVDGPKSESAVIYPGRSARNTSQPVYVVPNPYVRRADWEEGGAKVVFTNLPDRCRIRVFNESTELVATLDHGPEQSRTTSPTTATWDLKSDSGRELVSGVYIYYVEGSGIQETGKMMVAR